MNESGRRETEDPIMDEDRFLKTLHVEYTWTPSATL